MPAGACRCGVGGRPRLRFLMNPTAHLGVGIQGDPGGDVGVAGAGVTPGLLFTRPAPQLGERPVAAGLAAALRHAEGGGPHAAAALSAGAGVGRGGPSGVPSAPFPPDQVGPEPGNLAHPIATRLKCKVLQQLETLLSHTFNEISIGKMTKKNWPYFGKKKWVRLDLPGSGGGRTPGVWMRAGCGVRTPWGPPPSTVAHQSAQMA